MSGGSDCDDAHCVTCSDEGIPMRVVARQPDGVTLCADESGAQASVMTDLVEPVEAGDLVLVHAGVALTRLEEAAA